MDVGQEELNQNVVRTKSAEEEEVERLLAEIEERQGVVVDLEVQVETLKREVETFEARYYAASGGLLAQLHRLQVRIEECYLRVDEIEQDGRRAMEGQWEEDMRRAFREKQAAAEGYERRAREASARQKEQPNLTDEQQKDLKNLYRRLAKAFHPDLARSDGERERNARLMMDINDAYARGDVQHLRLLAEREQPHSTEPDELLSQRLERLRRQRDALDETIQRLRQQLNSLQRSEFYHLKREAEEAAARGRDYIAELAAKLKARVRQKEQELHWAQQELDEVMQQSARQRIRDKG